ncbi:protein SPA1-RELATED 4 isoform X1 [Physcomitrium patens]|uniref:protein SPA1-RELATED 4 isoform X1 n=1 Tax=Physcomitrium patens TaxID=3218 RepID=UPI000D17E5DF|nr:protein SPA1-RELATED 4-like isoform X1 [Physcomitrium patens]|eukprot:XP_024377593.1 protein SPA1-RELATED 4-like isoform X1 [Physcomitrella patens]
MKELPGRESGGVTEASSAQGRSLAKATQERVPLTSDDVDSEGSEGVYGEEITVRQWLSKPNREVDRVQSLHIFKQVLDFVDLAHGQGVMLRNIRPSCFLLSPLNRVAFIDSASTRSSSDQSYENSTGKGSASPERRHGDVGAGRRQAESSAHPPAGTVSSRPTSSSRDPDNRRPEQAVSCPWLPDWSGSTGSEGERRAGSRDGVQSSEMNSSSGKRVDLNSSDGALRNGEDCFPQRQLLHMEQAWYTSPEEHATGTSTYASDIYSLGVLMFEVLLSGHLQQLFCSFGSEVERARVMADLRNRILPPRLLSECPKEASFCLWLLHPDPACRPKSRDIYNCEILSEAGDAIAERQAAVQLEEKEAESEVLLEFLLRMQNQKQENARKLAQDVSRLSADIQEVERRRLALKKKRGPITKGENSGQRRITGVNLQERKGILGKRPHPEDGIGGREKGIACTDGRGKMLSKSARFMSNFNHLEKVYFSMNWRAGAPGMGMSKPSSRLGAQSLSIGCASNDDKKGISRAGEDNEEDWLGCFFDSLCKYARYSRFEVKATLRHGDLLNTANMVCSLSFDRDEEYFATAGVCKRIKVFECDTILNEHVDIHYPVVEMPCRSKLSSVCWNGYIKSHLASCDYEGVVQLWDANVPRVLRDYEEHEKRAWSVDFSKADPTKLASGSDDGTVKLWSINQESSIGTIKTKANVCCVQFPPDSGHLLTFGSADYKVYVYDLRTTKLPLCILASHQKAVSYVKFVDSVTLVSASTDNTLKLWDLTRANTTPHAQTGCSLTYTGHTNEKNFIGLSIADGYIACGSETNAVFAYHKSLPMEMASHKFGCTDPITGREVEEDGGQFVSSVCWRGKSQTLVAANSMGNIKILEMV